MTVSIACTSLLSIFDSMRHVHLFLSINPVTILTLHQTFDPYSVLHFVVMTAYTCIPINVEGMVKNGKMTQNISEKT